MQLHDHLLRDWRKSIFRRDVNNILSDVGPFTSLKKMLVQSILKKKKEKNCVVNVRANR